MPATKPGGRLGRRRLRAVKLIEELGLRTQRIEPLIRTLEDFSRRADELKERIDDHKRRKAPPAERQVWLREFRNIVRTTQETPTSIRKPRSAFAHYLRRLSAG